MRAKIKYIYIYKKQENEIKVGFLKILIKPDIPLAKLINKRHRLPIKGGNHY